MLYKDMVVWKVAKQITEEIYSLTETFSRQEMSNLGMQMRRAAVSIGANFVEGKNRGSIKEYARFVNIAIASAAELEAELHLAIAVGCIKGDIDFLLRKIGKEIGMLINLRRGLLRKKLP